VFVLYEENVGSITPLIAEELKEADEQYPHEWLVDAFREAAELNKRNWRYIRRILERWQTEGRDHEKRERDPQIEWLEQRYREGLERRATRR
jgi:DnaD/phage-associated family protein